MDFDRDGGNPLVAQIQHNIRELNQQVQTLDGFVTKLSDSSQAGGRSREQFNEMVHKAQDISKRTNQLMRQLVDLSNTERSLRIHRERLQNEYISVLNRFQGAQRRAAQAEKNSMQQVRETVEMDAAAQQQQDEFGRQRDQQLQRQQQVNIQQIKERQQSLQQLEQDIGDVNQIFSDLARMVHEQGDRIDSIEANVENANIHVEQGGQQLQQAVYYNQKARQKKCMLCVFVSLLLFIVALTVYLAR